MYSLGLQVFAVMQTKTTFTCLNSYNWLFEGKHNADMALCENEFDSPSVQQNERRQKDRHFPPGKRAFVPLEIWSKTKKVWKI